MNKNIIHETECPTDGVLARKRNLGGVRRKFSSFTESYPLELIQ